jgi:hypothetical protein
VLRSLSAMGLLIEFLQGLDGRHHGGPRPKTYQDAGRDPGPDLMKFHNTEHHSCI